MNTEQIAERAIIKALIVAMAAAGYQVAAVWDGEVYQMGGGKSYMPPAFVPDHAPGMDETAALEAIYSVDECTLHFTHKGKHSWGNRGVLLILGNGADVISDYHCADKNFDDVISAIYARIEDGSVA